MNLVSISKKITFLSANQVIYSIFFISLICAFRAVTSISLAAMIFTGILLHRHKLRTLLSAAPENLFIFSCVLFFLIQAISILYTHNLNEGLNDTRLKSGLVFTPLAVILTQEKLTGYIRRLLTGYCIILFIASIYLLCAAVNNYLQYRDSSSFFYHQLVSPFNYHAVYYSILVLLAAVFLLENLIRTIFIFSKPVHIVLIPFFSILLFLLSAKIAITFYIIYLILLFFRWKKTSPQANRFIFIAAILFIICSSFIFTTSNPVSNRFRDLLKGNPGLNTQQTFTPAVYFNGLQFRLLQWKLVPQILTENNCWWTGVSTGDAQSFLDKKYLSLHMYSGETGKPGTGYLGFNTHNQLLQSLLQCGIPGAIAFLFICFSLVRIAWKGKNRFLSFTILLLLCYLFVEALFEEQYGIVMVTCWPLFINRYRRENYRTQSAKII